MHLLRIKNKYHSQDNLRGSLLKLADNSDKIRV